MIRAKVNQHSQFCRHLPIWLLGVVVLFPLTLFTVGYLFAPETSSTNLRAFLSTLATAQAGVLAIVFSVAVIAIQLVSTRYSPRLVSLFIESPILKFTFWLFVASLVADFVLLYAIPQISSPIYDAGVFAVGGLALASFVTLYVFIRTILRQSTPEGIIETFASDLTPDKYLAKVRKSVEGDSTDVHPLRPLYSMIMEALSNRERATAETALQRYGDLADRTFEDFTERNVFEEEENQTARELFDPVFKEHLHDIALHAEEQDETQITREATDLQYELGRSGLSESSNRVSRQAIWGFNRLITHSPVGDNKYSSSNSAWDKLGDLMVDASEYPRPRIVWTAVSTVKSRLPWQLHSVPDRRRYRHSMTELYRCMYETQENLLDHYSEDVASVEMDWQYEAVPDDAQNEKAVSAVFRWRKALFKSTESFLHYRIEEGEYPITEGNFRHVWKESCIDAANSPAKEYAVALCQALIELAFIENCEGPYEEEESIPFPEDFVKDDSLFWVNHLSQVANKGDPEVVREAFDRILAYEFTDDTPPLMTVDNMEKVRQKYYQNMLTTGDYRTLNTHSEFPEMVEELQKQVQQRTE